jgi:hypothetical protein
MLVEFSAYRSLISAQLWSNWTSGREEKQGKDGKNYNVQSDRLLELDEWCRYNSKDVSRFVIVIGCLLLLKILIYLKLELLQFYIAKYIL